MAKENIAVVLVEPQGPLNIGSVCRAMMNFGFSDLRLVNPQTEHLCDEAYRMAVKAKPLLEQAKVYPDLPSALADTVLAVGTTRRFGKYREDFVSPAEAGDRLISLATSEKTAILFGREDRGLLTEELDLCQLFLTIPTSDELPSMNLAQAVSLCLYEVSNSAAKRPSSRSGPPGQLANTAEMEAMFSHMRQSLLDLGYLNPQNPDHILRTFRRIFSRAILTKRDVRVLQGLWSKMEWQNGEFARLRQEDGDE